MVLAGAPNAFSAGFDLKATDGWTSETDDLKRTRDVQAASGDELKVELVRGRVRVDGARVTGDYNAANGTIVAVDSVLLPN